MSKSSAERLTLVPSPGESSVQSDAPKTDSGLMCLCVIAASHNIVADPGRLAHDGALASSASVEDLLRLARHIGLKSRLMQCSVREIGKLPLPSIVSLTDGRFLILAKTRKGHVLLHDPVKATPIEMKLSAFSRMWTGKIILLTTRPYEVQGSGHFDFSWFIPSIVKYRRMFMEVLTGSLVLQLFALAAPLISQVAIDKVLVHKSLSTLDVLVFALVAIAIFECVLSGLRAYTLSHTTNRIDVELGVKMFSHLLNLPLAYFQSRRVGDCVARVRELDTIRNFLTGNTLTVLLDCMFTLVFLAAMLMYSVQLTLLVLASLVFYVFLSLSVTPPLRARLRTKFKRYADNQAFLMEVVTGVETIKSMAVEPMMQRRWESQLASYVSSAFLASNLSSIAVQCSNLIDKLGRALLMWYGARMVMSGDLTLGEMIAINLLAGRVAQPILRMSQLLQDFQQVRLSMDRLGDILDTKGEKAPSSAQFSSFSIDGAVEFDQVFFRYRVDGPEILRGLSLSVQPGEIVGIVGASGSGKSTLTKLIQRLYVAERGQVLIDGKNLAATDPAVLRSQIGVVLQDTVLFTGSVRENIALANPSMSFDEVIQVARLAGAHEFITELQHGYETVLGERGVGLSGGQRQRIAIARALAIKPRILIFDEATAALDAKSERIIQENMQSICSGKTVFIIAHRLSAVRIANRIIAMDHGQVVESGSHVELLKQNGCYASLWRDQMRGVV